MAWLHPFRNFQRFSTHARKAIRRGDAVEAERWQRLAALELRIVAKYEDQKMAWVVGTAEQMTAHLDRIRAELDQTERQLADAQRRAQLAERRS